MANVWGIALGLCALVVACAGPEDPTVVEPTTSRIGHAAPDAGAGPGDLQRPTRDADVARMIDALIAAGPGTETTEARKALVLAGTRTVTAVIALLEHDQRTVRDSAAWILAKLRDPRAIEPLVAALATTVDSESAHTALVVFKEAAVEPLIAALGAPDATTRAAAAMTLGAIGEVAAAAEQPLLAALADQSAGVRRKAAKALGRIGVKDSSAALIVLLSDSDHFTRGNAAEALGRLRAVDAVDALLPLLADDEGYVRLHTCKALGAIGDQRAIGPLLARLHDDSVVFELHQALERLKVGDEWVPMLVGELKSKDSTVRAGAIYVLQDIGAASSVKPIAKLLADRDDHVRWAAVRALAILKSPKSVPALIKVIDDAEIGVEAVRILGNMDDKRAVKPLITALKSKDTALILAAIGALANIADRRAMKPLIALLDHEQRDVRREAGAALGVFSPHYIKPLIRILSKGASTRQRVEAASILGDSCDKRAVEALIDAVDDDAQEVAGKASEMLNLNTEQLLATKDEWTAWWKANKKDVQLCMRRYRGVE